MCLIDYSGAILGIFTARLLYLADSGTGSANRRSQVCPKCRRRLDQSRHHPSLFPSLGAPRFPGL